jgi:hypothetical protein
VEELGPDDKRMRLRYAGTCRVCGVALPAKGEAIYERSSKTVRCTVHDQSVAEKPPQIADVEDVEAGVPGASARREFERRKSNREMRVRTKHPKLKAWDVGAIGEERLGNRLNELASETVRVLHDRRIPGTRANIDHLAVTPSGVYVIDAKKYKGRPHLRVEGGVLRPRVERLLVGSRDCTKVVDGVLKQVDLARGIVGDDVPLHGVLCFVEAAWPLLGGAFTTRGVEALWPKKLYSKLNGAGPLSSETIVDLHGRLAAALPPA